MSPESLEGSLLKEEPSSLELGGRHWEEPGLIFTQDCSDSVTAIIANFLGHKSYDFSRAPIYSSIQIPSHSPQERL